MEDLKSKLLNLKKVLEQQEQEKADHKSDMKSLMDSNPEEKRSKTFIEVLEEEVDKEHPAHQPYLDDNVYEGSLEILNKAVERYARQIRK